MKGEVPQKVKRIVLRSHGVCQGTMEVRPRRAERERERWCGLSGLWARAAGSHLVLLDRAEVIEGHVERAVAVDEEHRLVWARDLCANGRGEAEAHRTEGAGCDHLARLGPPNKLAGHHLVVAHARPGGRARA